MSQPQRALRFVIWTLLIFSPLPREWAQPTADMLADLLNGFSLHHPAPRTTTHAG